MSKKSKDWYTPWYLFEHFASSMGQFALFAEPDRFCARDGSRFHEGGLDALRDTDEKLIWLNPKASDIPETVETVLEKVEHDEGVRVFMLLPNRTDTAWFHRIISSSVVRAVVFVQGRVKFMAPTGLPGEAPRFGNMVVLFGSGGDGKPDFYSLPLNELKRHGPEEIRSQDKRARGRTVVKEGESGPPRLRAYRGALRTH